MSKMKQNCGEFEMMSGPFRANTGVVVLLNVEVGKGPCARLFGITETCRKKFHCQNWLINSENFAQNSTPCMCMKRFKNVGIAEK